ncbi:ExbD/TolR family protein [Flexithrix dorotheae]|uniref:ExbD/TolR family protein n=1 Tax=Flexithrix dorotheae TaxID=70993 RepID=UPI0012FC5476|nr:biopolymer transporter ExbD [Flexithrix dorotheae]
MINTLKKRSNKKVEINSGSMADIAFLLLIFFLVTTTIASEKGIMMLLPPKIDNPEIVDIKNKNLFKILINGNDELLVEEERISIGDLNQKTKAFISNNGKDPLLSENPSKAIVSIQSHRGTSYATYIKVLDEVKKSYYQLRAESLGLDKDQYMALDKKNPFENELIQKGKANFPMLISEAEPLDSPESN